MYTQVTCIALGYQQKVSDPWELELQVVGSWPGWSRIKLLSSRRVKCFYPLSPLSPVPRFYSFKLFWNFVIYTLFPSNSSPTPTKHISHLPPLSFSPSSLSILALLELSICPRVWSHALGHEKPITGHRPPKKSDSVPSAAINCFGLPAILGVKDPLLPQGWNFQLPWPCAEPQLLWALVCNSHVMAKASLSYSYRTE